MKISSHPKTYDGNNSCQSFKSLPSHPIYLPEATATIGKVAGEYIKMPEQRLILALTALLLQPIIDLKFAHKDKKTDSAIKSASKAFVGGCTGVTIRAAFIYLTSKCIGFRKNNRLNTDFLPDAVRKMYENEPEKAIKLLKQYNATLGTIFAMVFMILFSNSKVDVPLTSDLQDLLTGVIKEKKSWLQSFKDVKDSRCRKIKAWFEKRIEFFKRLSKKTQKIAKVITEDDSADKTGGKK